MADIELRLEEIDKRLSSIIPDSHERGNKILSYLFSLDSFEEESSIASDALPGSDEEAIQALEDFVINFTDWYKEKEDARTPR